MSRITFFEKDKEGKWKPLKSSISNSYVTSSYEDFPCIRAKVKSKQISDTVSFNFFKESKVSRSQYYTIRFFYEANLFTATDTLKQYDLLGQEYLSNISDTKTLIVYSDEFDIYIKNYNKYDKKALKWLSKQPFNNFFFYNNLSDYWKKEREDNLSDYNFALKTISMIQLFQKKFPKSSFIPQSNLFLAELYYHKMSAIEGFDNEYYRKKAIGNAGLCFVQKCGAYFQSPQWHHPQQFRVRVKRQTKQSCLM